jgi:hypothetical protein
MKRERQQRLQIMLTDAELRAVDDFRFKFRVPSRAAAVRELLNRGLRSHETGAATINSRSKDFGVLETDSLFDPPQTTARSEELRPAVRPRVRSA